MPRALTPRFQAFRLVTFRLDGQPHSKTIDHSPGLAPSVQSRYLQRRFLEWLEREFPGCLAAGRVTHIVHADDVRRISDLSEFDSGSTAA